MSSTIDTYLDISEFGMHLSEKNQYFTVYRLNPKFGHGKLIIYNILTGVEVIYSEYCTDEIFKGRVELEEFIEIAYSHEGIYDYQLKNKKHMQIGAGDIAMFYNINESNCSRLPISIYKGINIMLHLNHMDSETYSLLDQFGISIDRIFSNFLKDKPIFLMKDNIILVKALEELYYATINKNLSYIKIKTLEALFLMGEEVAVSKNEYRVFSKEYVSKVHKIKNLLEENIAHHYTIKDLSYKFNMSQTMLKDCFKHIYGFPPYEYLKRLRIGHGLVHLRDDRYSVADVANMVGYGNPSKFTKAFKDVSGVTPSEYKRIVHLGKTGGLE